MAAWKLFLAISVICLRTRSSIAEKVSEVDCTKDAADQCKQTPNAECNNADNTAKCQCSNGYEEDSNDDSKCVPKRVSEVDCTKGSVDQCTQTPNAECNNANTGAKCQCSKSYKEDSNDGRTCVPKRVSEVDCTKGTADQCTHTPNAECNNDNTAAKCQCSNGYEENSNDGSTCVLKRVSEVDCTKDTEKQCIHTPNAECNNDETGAKCQCSSGYKEDSNDGSTCVLKTVIDTDCSANGNECNSIDNAECDGQTNKCKCSTNFVMNVGKCVPENAGAFTEVGVLTIVLSVLSTVQMVVR